MTTAQLVISILVIAVLTFLTRALPFLVFAGKKEMPRIIQYLGKALPFAVMGLLVVFCVRWAVLELWGGVSGDLMIAAGIAIAVTAGVHLWWKNLLVSVMGGTAVYMVLVQVVF